LASKHSVAQLAKLVEVSPRTAQYWVGKIAVKEEA
jgi:hypothetical protein